jgi:hypothetical protein
MRTAVLIAAVLGLGVLLVLVGVDGVRSVRGATSTYDALVTDSRVIQVRRETSSGGTRVERRSVVEVRYDDRTRTLRDAALQQRVARGDRIQVVESDVTGSVVRVHVDDMTTIDLRTVAMSMAFYAAGVTVLAGGSAASAALWCGRRTPDPLHGDVAALPARP